MRGWYEKTKENVLEALKRGPLNERDLWRKVSGVTAEAQRNSLKELGKDRKIHWNKNLNKWELPTWYGQR